MTTKSTLSRSSNRGKRVTFKAGRAKLSEKTNVIPAIGASTRQSVKVAGASFDEDRVNMLTNGVVPRLNDLGQGK